MEPKSKQRSFAALKLGFEQELRRRSQVVLHPIAQALSRLGATPNSLTVIGLLLNTGVAVVLALGALRWGGVLLLLASSFDALDGALARLTGRQSRFGAFFDSSIDRYSEAVVMGGILVYFLKQGDWSPVPLIYAAMVGSIMVSYTRARAEGIGVDCKVGLLTRLERMVLLAAGLVLNYLTPVLWALAILANLTAVQRILHVRRALSDIESNHP